MSREITAESILFIFGIFIGMYLLDTYGRVIFSIFAIFVGIFGFVIFLSWIIPRKIDAFIERFDTHISELYTHVSREKYDISEILSVIEEASRIFKRSKILILIARISHSQKLNITLHTYADYIDGTILRVLLHLRKELTEKISEETNILYSTKSQLKKIHTGNNEELYRIQQLQSTRLDRQIEQFEELQRVMVKV